MIKVFALGGVPASGKTTVARRLFASMGFQENLISRHGLLRYHYSAQYNAAILGVYGEGLYAGTDRLCYSVQPHVEDFLDRQARLKNETLSVFFEGDRLFNTKMLNLCRRLSTDMRAVILECSFQTLVYRHEYRNDHQRASWLRGRQTKLDNIARDFPLCEKRLNENEFDASAIAMNIKAFLTGGNP